LDVLLTRSNDSRSQEVKMDDLELATGLVIPSVGDPILDGSRQDLKMTKVKDALISLKYAVLAYKYNETKVYSGHVGKYRGMAD
jgi:lysine/ornithine N-monooxygenase